MTFITLVGWIAVIMCIYESTKQIVAAIREKRSKTE